MEALKTVEQTPPDLVLLDIVMANIDGFEVCRRLKANEQLCHVPVIFLSATSEKQERVIGFQLGAVDFVAKPFQRQELLARVRTHLALTRMQAELKRQADDLRNANVLLQSEIAVRETMASSLAESEERFRTLAASAQDAFVILDEEDRIVFWNHSASEMFGHEEKEVMRQKFHELLVPERLQDAVAARFLDRGNVAERREVVEMTAVRKGGEEFPTELSLSSAKIRGKWVAIAVIRDVTARQRAQEDLQRSEERLNLALESAHMGSWDLDLVTGRAWRSRIHAQIFGYSDPNASWSLERFLEHVLPDDRARLLEEIAVARKTGQLKSECRIVRNGDHQQRWISFHGTVYSDTQKRPVRMMGLVLDITEVKQAEDERKMTDAQNSLSQKLESVGRLAAGIAHEINTPMQFISDKTQFLKSSLSSLTEVLTAYRGEIETIASGDSAGAALTRLRAVEEEKEMNYLLEEIPKTFSETMSGLQRVTQIIKSLKEFSHPNKSSKQPADLNKAINTTITVSRHEWKYVAEVVPELDPDLPMIPVRIDEINQVVLNLIVNASHAIGDALKQRVNAKGIIAIRTRQENDSVVIEVEDNGTGIPDSAQSHIFEPFFTTKGVGKGTGQGLAIIRTIVVKNHGGTISFTTEPGKGTTFHVRLPLTVPEETPTAGMQRASGE
jgi:PAS domain S-box-containing protein